jgi:hypothetical protein
LRILQSIGWKWSNSVLFYCLLAVTNCVFVGIFVPDLCIVKQFSSHQKSIRCKVSL